MCWYNQMMIIVMDLGTLWLQVLGNIQMIIIVMDLYVLWLQVLHIIQMI